ncbi:MAG TPA: hypothetical protein VJ898_05470 [Natrialbaceae archaeon]|nr:hypothetical protein [Natrialbaceae archaeon]
MVEDTNSRSTDRRTVLTTVGTAFVGLAAGVGSVAAKSESSAKAAGIHTAVQRLLHNGNHRQARRLLEKHDIAHDVERRRMPSVGHDEHKGDISKQDQWTKSESKFSHTSWRKAGDVYHSLAQWDLEKIGEWETDGPKDAVGITFNPDLWEIVNGSWDFDDQSSLAKRGQKGIIVEYDDPRKKDELADTTGWASIDYEKTEAGNHNVYGTYCHTWVPLGIPGWVSFSLSAGPIGVSTSGRVDTWKKRADNNL